MIIDLSLAPVVVHPPESATLHGRVEVGGKQSRTNKSQPDRSSQANHFDARLGDTRDQGPDAGRPKDAVVALMAISQSPVGVESGGNTRDSVSLTAANRILTRVSASKFLSCRQNMHVSPRL